MDRLIGLIDRLVAIDDRKNGWIESIAIYIFYIYYTSSINCSLRKLGFNANFFLSITFMATCFPVFLLTPNLTVAKFPLHNEIQRI